MGKKFITIIAGIFLLASNPASAAENGVIWGVKASIDAEIPGKWHGKSGSVEMYSPGYGLSVGGVANLYLGRNFYFEPGAALTFSHYSYKDLYVADSGGNFVSKNPQIEKWGVQIPLTVGYTVAVGDRPVLNIFTGPQLRYTFSGELKTDITDLRDYVDSFTDFWNINGHRRAECSWKIGVGFPTGSFNVMLEADLGITDMLKGDMRFHENRVGLGLAYYF